MLDLERARSRMAEVQTARCGVGLLLCRRPGGSDRSMPAPAHPKPVRSDC